MSTNSPATRLRNFVGHRVIAPAIEDARHSILRIRNRNRTYRPLFVTGAMGSGTTLLAFLLGQRLDAAGVVAESARHISRRSFLYVPRTDGFASIPEFETALQADPDWSPAIVNRDLQRLYRSRAVRDSHVIIDKGPNTNLTRASLLERSFPDSRFVMIYRDPVANIEGFRRKWRLFGRSSLDEAIGFYRHIHEAFLRAAEDFAESVRVVNYRDLVQHDAEILEWLGDWAGLTVASEPLELPNRGSRRGRGARNIENGRIKVVSGADRESYGRLTEPEISRIQDELSDLMERLDARAWTPDAAPASPQPLD